MSSSSKSEYVHGVFTTIAPTYDLMNDLESLGMHRLWKAQLVRELSRSTPAHVLDIACGTGDIALALAKANPQAVVTGLDFCEEMLEVARARAARELPLSFTVELPTAYREPGQTVSSAQGTSHDEDDPEHCHPRHGEGSLPDSSGQAYAKSNNNIKFIEGDALKLPFADDSFDAVSISFGLRNMPDYGAVLKEIRRVLRPGGAFRCLEASYPTNPVIKPPFKLYFKHWLPVLGKLIVNSPEEYSWLNTSTEAFLSKDELAQLMSECGFTSVGYSSFLFGAAALHRGTA